MDHKEIAGLALELQTLLIAHDKAFTQIQLIDSKLSTLTAKIFSAHEEGHQGLRLHLLSRKSVVEGVRQAFHQYRVIKWNQIRELSNLILDTFAIDSSTLPLPPQPDHVHQQIEEDDLATTLTIAYSVCSRTW
ncbi:uncharacterized protein LOC110447299 [Mizuhopecten yessoensis]|uniref:Uncharacterized protein n=1 Tax=Mizuhopecten yessoensis TaxID=6573 RepID=A0A210R6B6_MIZYE|nr:uncharacterized protein LOC110447295 [Mizuhopecten yessoensis]XP_021348580.1 uncharacterized protein LOC110447299 [Mizuhopecten yessoensis]OWF56454.1 hypothetical protein KP79_PYT12839 [Mizuhopecten yessoensis]OWF56456.1 hypothetical protein KP79_PYT12841 [Mizuhopecten yessoensis]